MSFLCSNVVGSRSKRAISLFKRSNLCSPHKIASITATLTIKATNDMDAENVREIVNGKLLQQFNGKKVSLTGSVRNVASNGLSFDVQAADNVTVKVTLRKPHDGPLDGVVEVHGTSKGTSIVCDEVLVYDKEPGAEDFDVEGHNSVCTLLNSASRLWDLD